MRLTTIQNPDVDQQDTRVALEMPDIGFVDLKHILGSKAFDDAVYSSMPRVLERLDEVARMVQELSKLKAGGRSTMKTSREAEMLPPVPRPPSFRDFYAFEEHVKAARARRNLPVPPEWYERPVFYFSNPGTLIGHNADVSAPQGSKELDYELELGVIIKCECRSVAPKDAWDVVAGFTIINDWSARDLQRQEMAVGLGPCKGKDFATSVGPCIVTLDELRDKINGEGQVDLTMSARVNGKELSRGNAAAMHFPWPRLIAEASRDTVLYPGDLLGSGTVGTGCILELGPDNTGGWLKPGDVVELEIERLGVLRNQVV